MSQDSYMVIEAGEAGSGGMAIATVNMHSVYDKEANRAKYITFIAMAAARGADLLVMPTAYPKSGPLTMNGTVRAEEYSGYTYDIFEKCRAMENQVWFVSADHVGVDPKGCFDFYGHSRIIHPSGVPVIELGKEEGMAIAHGLDIKGEVLKARTKWFFGLNLLADRSPELYREIADTETMTS